ncbi:MAG: CoA-acylating methylmalonate-semialdehyde dehydrogenase [Phycisphaeraceae bacterium]
MTQPASPSATPASDERLANWIGHAWRASTAADFTPVFNCSTGQRIAQTPLSTAADVDQAVDAAAAAFPAWSRTPVPDRAQVMFRFKQLLEAHFEALARLVTLENGKTLAEAKGDVRRGIEVIEFACGMPHLIKGESLPQVASHIDGVTTREPIGVCAGITPFNFPAMVPMWMFPLAIACGNCFILKPSEKVPLTANRLAELLAEAGLPAGVLNVVHGGRDVVEAICDHPGIVAISFVGSTRVAEQVYTRGCAAGKRVQAAGGAKNALVVMPDAEPDSTLRAVLGAAYGCAGQRCMAGSLIMGVGEAGDALNARLGEAIDQMKILPTDRHDDSDMGPVIDSAARDRLFDAIDAGQREGATLVRDGRRSIPSEGFFVGPTLFDHVQPDMAIARTELFGPVLAMQRATTLDDAIDRINTSAYGNGAVIFTTNGAAARQFAQGVNCGMVGVNVGVPAPMAMFAFSGWNRSFFGDLHVQGAEGVNFYTRQKLVLSRWDDSYSRKLGW